MYKFEFNLLVNYLILTLLESHKNIIQMSKFCRNIFAFVECGCIIFHKNVD